jgi:hypothetical protein
MKYTSLLVAAGLALGNFAHGNQISESQKQFVERYREQKKIHSAPHGVSQFRNLKVKELEAQDGQTNLFQSGDFSGWTRVNGRPVSGGWTITDGVIRRGGLRPGDIVTTGSYKDFELEFEWKISAGGNSGVKYRTRGGLGLEYQILDDAGHRDGKTPSRTAGSLYDLLAAAKTKPLRPAGEWNHGRIVARGDHIEHWMNGEKILEVTVGDDEWRQRLGQSKYAKHEDFGTWTGPILLQDHLDEVWFRNIRIRGLEST